MKPDKQTQLRLERADLVARYRQAERNLERKRKAAALARQRLVDFDKKNPEATGGDV